MVEIIKTAPAPDKGVRISLGKQEDVVQGDDMVLDLGTLSLKDLRSHQIRITSSDPNLKITLNTRSGWESHYTISQILPGNLYDLDIWIEPIEQENEGEQYEG